MTVCTGRVVDPPTLSASVIWVGLILLVILIADVTITVLVLMVPGHVIPVRIIVTVSNLVCIYIFSPWLLSLFLYLVVGEFCEFCLPGSYGDATIYPGCLACNCNGHGVASLNYCHPQTGVCYCEGGFEGDNCEVCSIGSIGDPR